MRVTEIRLFHHQILVPGILHPEPGRRNRELASRGQIVTVRDREEGDAAELHARHARPRIKRDIEDDMPAFVGREAKRGSREEPHDVARSMLFRLGLIGRWFLCARWSRD